MPANMFHSTVAHSRGVQACECVGAGFISLTPRPHSAFAADPDGYLFVMWSLSGDGGAVTIRAFRLDGPQAPTKDAINRPAIRCATTVFAPPSATPIVTDFGLPWPTVTSAQAAEDDGLPSAVPQATAQATVTIRELRDGHPDVVWPMTAIDVPAVQAMLRAHVPGGVPKTMIGEVAELLARDGVTTAYDAIYVVESATVRETATPVCDHSDIVVTDGRRFTPVRLDDVDSLAALVGVLPHDPAGLRRFGAQLAVNGAATYNHCHAFSPEQTFKVETPEFDAAYAAKMTDDTLLTFQRHYSQAVPDRIVEQRRTAIANEIAQRERARIIQPS